MRRGQIIGGIGGGACPSCGQFQNACDCLARAEQWAAEFWARCRITSEPAPRRARETTIARQDGAGR